MRETERSLEMTNAFKRDLKRSFKSDGQTLQVELNPIIALLQNDEPLPAKNRDHTLTGNYNGFRECHIRPDLLLIYRQLIDSKVLTLVRLGSHSELF